MFSGMTTYIIEGKMLGKATPGRIRMELLHDMMGEIIDH